MIIQSDQISTGASRNYYSSRASYTRYNTWNSSGVITSSTANVARECQSAFSKSCNGNTIEEEETEKKVSEEKDGSYNPFNFRNLMEEMSASSQTKRTSLQSGISNFQKIQQQTLSYLFDLLLGRKSKVLSFASADDAAANNSDFADFLTSEDSGLYGAGGNYYSSFYYSERETTCFDAKGKAVTADGREISFNINLEMSRSFTQIAETEIDFGKPRLCDPLVINLSGGAADVTDQKFFFDIDADGEKDEISSLGSKSGYLALDKNGDGIIGDGSELFGTQSGNGFEDLAAYDKDKNGWIDEADEIFQKLKIWTKDENGNDRLLTLAEAGVGAICLKSEDTNYSLNSMETNETNAVVRKTGLFLYENGGSGTIQQLDLAT